MYRCVCVCVVWVSEGRGRGGGGRNTQLGQHSSWVWLAVKRLPWVFIVQGTLGCEYVPDNCKGARLEARSIQVHHIILHHYASVEETHPSLTPNQLTHCIPGAFIVVC